MGRRTWHVSNRVEDLALTPAERAARAKAVQNEVVELDALAEKFEKDAEKVLRADCGGQRVGNGPPWMEWRFGGVKLAPRIPLSLPSDALRTWGAPRLRLLNPPQISIGTKPGDIIVLGAGLVGSLCAVVLCKKGFQVRQH